MSTQDFYTEVIDLLAIWQEIVEDGSSEDIPDEAIDLLRSVVRTFVAIAERTNPGGYHTEVFNIERH